MSRRRQLQVAVAEESYALAARLRDEQKALMERFPPVLQFALGQIPKLKSSDRAEQLSAIRALGRLY